MSKQKRIEQEIEKTMQALDGAERAQTDDYFFTRLQARIEREKELSVASAIWNEPRYAFGIAAVFMIIVFNIFSLIQYQAYSDAVDDEELNTISAEFTPGIPLLYELSEVQNGD